MSQGEIKNMSGWYYDTLPNVKLDMSGRLSVKTDDDFQDDKMRSHFDQSFNWRIDENADEFVIRFSRKPEAPSHGHINIDVKIEGGLSTQPDGSVLFDGGLGDGEGNNVSKFSLSFEISHESPPDSVFEEEWEQPEEQEIKFFHHPKHKLLLAPENYYNDVAIGSVTCDACTEPVTKENARWVYECPNKPDCDYCVHANCAQLARTIRHPSHLKHSLKLLKLAPGRSKICDVCKEIISCGLHYNCAKCDFDLHPQCPDPDKAPGDGVGEVCVMEMTPALMHMRLLQQQQLNMAQHLAANMANAGQAMSNLCG